VGNNWPYCKVERHESTNPEPQVLTAIYKNHWSTETHNFLTYYMAISQLVYLSPNFFYIAPRLL